MFDRQKELAWAKLRVGFVVTAALAGLFLTVLFAGDIEGLFSPKITLTARIPDAKGLRDGSPVWISGVEVGAVSDIRLDPAYGTSVVLAIEKGAMRFIKKDSQAAVLTMGLLGDKYVELTTGSAGAGQAAPGDVITGVARAEVQDLIKSGTASVQKMTDLLARIEKGEGTLSKFVRDPDVYDNLRETTKDLSLLVRDIRNSRGSLRLFIDDRTLYDRAASAVSSIDELSRRINSSSGSLKGFVEDPSLYNRLRSAADALNEFGYSLNNSEGTMKRLIEDPSLYNNLDRASSQLSLVLEGIESGNGVAGALLRDEDLALELRQAVEELRLLTRDIKENPKRYFKFSIF